MAATPVFYYDVSSPYAYLAARRINELLPSNIVWQPIAFGALIREIGKVPWSLAPYTREAGMREVERRARERGLPVLRWPPGWPVESYSVKPLRALLWARDQDRIRELTLELFDTAFVQGRALNDVEPILESGARAGLDREQLAEAIERPDLKQALRDATAEALARGVSGVPTVAVGDQLHWGDDRLESAAAALSATQAD